MSVKIDNQWFLDLNENEKSFASFDLLIIAINQAQSLETGRLWSGKDAGPRPWWHRILGTQKRYVVALFSLEWYEQTASLIFHDENWSEYRTIDKKCPVNIDESIRLKIAHGELKPHPIEECMEKERAFKAIEEYLKTSNRPDWLEYRFVE